MIFKCIDFLVMQKLHQKGMSGKNSEKNQSKVRSVLLYEHAWFFSHREKKESVEKAKCAASDASSLQCQGKYFRNLRTKLLVVDQCLQFESDVKTHNSHHTLHNFDQIFNDKSFGYRKAIFRSSDGSPGSRGQAYLKDTKFFSLPDIECWYVLAFS